MNHAFHLSRRRARFLSVGIASLIAASGAAHAQTFTWSGAGGSGSWAAGANWGGPAPDGGGDDILQFGGTTQLATSNDLINWSGTQLQFLAGAGIFTIAGSPITVEGSGGAAGILDSASTNTATITAVLAGAGGIRKSGTGTIILGGAAANTYAGTLIVDGGRITLGKSAGNAVTGDLIVNTGASVIYATNAGNTGLVTNQIADTANITVSGGAFGDYPAQGTNPTNTGATETAANLSVSAGTFSTGRAVFTLTSAVTVSGGLAYAHRGGTITATSVTVSGPGSIGMDGGSTTAANYSRITVGAGGLTLNDGNINFNVIRGTSTAGTSVGSVLTLNGNVVSTGVSAFNRFHTELTVGLARVDLGGGIRTFDVAGTLTSGTTAAPVIFNNGGLNKAGAGALVLPGAQTYTGATTITTGTLQATGSMLSPVTVSGGIYALSGSTTTATTVNAGTFNLTGTAAAVNINNGGVLTGNGSISGVLTAAVGSILNPGANGAGILTANSLSFSGSAALNVTTASSITIGGANQFFVNGGANSVTIHIGGAAVVGTYPLFDYAGAILGTGAGFNAFTLGNLPRRVIASLVDNSGATRVDVSVTGIDVPEWTGLAGTEWSTSLIANPKNWRTRISGTPDDFVTADPVAFTDLPGSNQIVDISVADVSPVSVSFENSARDYTITGTHGIAGATSVVKSGAASVTISNTNSFTGNFTINAGTVRVAAISAAGSSGSLGSGNDIVFGGGTLEFTSPAGATNRGVVLNGTGGSVRTAAGNSLTLSGAISGSGTLTKVGAGTVIISNSNNTFAATKVDEGVLQLGDGGATGTFGSGIVTNNALVAYDIEGAVPTVITGPGRLEKRGTTTTTITGATANTYTGLTTIVAGTLIAGKTAGIDAISGDLQVGSGAFFRFAGNNTSNQIADTSSVTVNGGTFGDVTAVGVNPTNPGAAETVANFTLNGGNFSTGRATFTTTGLFKVTGGVALAHRGGIISAHAAEVSGGSIDLDGTTTSSPESRLDVGVGGLTLANGIVNLNSAAGVASATSVGSIVRLSGNVVSTGNSRFANVKPAVMTVAKAQIDLRGANRTFDVAGTLDIGSPASLLVVINGIAGSPAGIVKTGPGNLVLPGIHTYDGPTTVNGGTFTFDGTLATSSVAIGSGATFAGRGSIAGSLTVGNGATISPGLSNQGGITVPSLTVGAGSADTATFNLSRGSSPAIITVTTPDAFVVNGGANTVTVNLVGSNPGIGQHILIDYQGTLGGTGVSAFKLGTIPSRISSATIINDTVNSAIVLDITASALPVWSGAWSNEWSLRTLSAPKNWVLSSAPGTTTDFLSMDDVVFDDSAPATATSVDISVEDVNPTSTHFNNTVRNYTIGGSNAISGTGEIIKDGTGRVTIATSNTFTGRVQLNAGTLSVAAVGNAGAASPLGAGSTLGFNGGTFEYTGPLGSTDRGIDIGTNGGTLKTDADLTLAGIVAGTGALIKRGTGGITLGAANPNFNGGLVIQQGTVRFGGGDATGGATQSITLDGGTLEFTGTTQVTLAAASLATTAAGGTVLVPNGTSAAADGFQINRANTLSGAGSITKEGQGTLRIAASNPGFSGNWSVRGGALEGQFADSLGSGKITLEPGATLVSQSKAAPASFLLNNDVILNGGTLQARSGDFGGFAGVITVAAPSTVMLRSFTSPGTSGDVTFGGPIQGSSTLTVAGNNPQTPASQTVHALRLSNPATTFSGTFAVSGGQALLSAPPTSGNTLGTATISLTESALAVFDNGTGNNGTLPYGNNIIVNGTTAASVIQVDHVTANTGNIFQFGALNVASGGLAVTGFSGYGVEFSGSATFAPSVTVIAQSADISLKGSITGGGGIFKTGPNRLSFGGAAAFGGNVDVRNGTLAVNSTLSGNIVVNGSLGAAFLAGTGAIAGNVNVTAATGGIAPGNNGAGILSVGGNVALFSASSFNVDVSHNSGGTPLAGTDYDRLNVGTGGVVVSTGSVDLAGANLNISTGIGFLPNDLFFIIVNDGADIVTGTFGNIPAPGIPFVVNGLNFEISYDADSAAGTFHGGNDVALLVPEPGSAALFLGGLAMVASRRRGR